MRRLFKRFVFELTHRFLNKLGFELVMNGKIVAFRGSHKTKYGNHMIVMVDGVDNKEKAVELEGKKAMWANPEGKKKIVISGTVSKAHGGKGCVRVVFEKGLPGQSLGTKVEVN